MAQMSARRSAPTRGMAAPPPPAAPIQATAATANFGGPSAYGFGAASGGLFSSAQPQQQSAASFGGGSSSSFLFGAPAPSMNAASGGLFGSAQSPQPQQQQQMSPPRRQRMSQPGDAATLQQLQQKQQLQMQMQMAQQKRQQPQQQQQQQQQQQMAQHAVGSSQSTFGNASPSGNVDDDHDKTPLEAIIALQTFSGSWTWSAALERLLGVTQDAASKALQVTSEAATATLCAMAYLQAKLAEEEEVWELVVDKAREWLTTTLSLGEDDVKALEGKAQQVLG